MMTIEIIKGSDEYITISVSSILTFEEMQSVQDSVKDVLTSKKKVNCLLLVNDFQGWGKGGDWGDLTFMYESDPNIAKIAVVADERWKDELMMFLGDGRRQAEVRHFHSDEEQDARNWLAGSDV
jgi:hypothetical protein